ncbi:VWA domain-containing protein [Aliiroseovarius sp. YM-037]|uniref:VWA domain-containing protein n=1 Tax=Aliiroseovarius sp. YM-037 TaxID=3341728 RepID=UPI003A8109C7
MRNLLAVLFSALLTFTAHAQETGPRTILVLDGSGSMWGQIDGVTKIEIAQEVIGGLLQTLPDDQELGLTAYGHRRDGDCTDIETLIAPAAGQRAAISEAVNGISPKGKTPLSAAVLAAAQSLRYTEETATVILVSDGRETCDLDPCAVGAELEASGVDFTAHVIGFDVTDPEDQAQLQCLAEATGGTYRTASNAAELTDALTVVAEPEPAPEPVAIVFRAVESEGGPEVTEQLVWELSQDGSSLGAPVLGPKVAAQLLPGEYGVKVLRPSDETTAESSFIVADEEQTVTLILPIQLPDATIEAPETAVAGSTINVTWTGPDDERDYVSVARLDDPNGYVNYTYTRDGSPSGLLMPPTPGSYELRYILADGRSVLATKPIEITPVEASLDAPEAATAGETVDIGWTGPDYDRDYISVARLDDPRGYENYVYTRDGSPGGLVMPSEPGEYEIRYVMAQATTVIASENVTVVPVEATLDAPAAAVAGSTLNVAWTGPDYARDYIAISQPGDKGYETYTYSREGTPLGVKVPLEPGTYELRYVMSQDTTVLATQTLEVTEVGATLDAVENAPAGSLVVVHWDGPDYGQDYISISAPSAEDTKYDAYTRTNEGSPLLLRMPAEPGEYELRYIATGDQRSVLVRRGITATEVTASITAPDSAPAGGRVAIYWDGPDYRGDYIDIVKDGETDYRSYINTSQESPMVLELPEGPGKYAIRYMTDRGKKVLASHPIELTYEAAQ